MASCGKVWEKGQFLGKKMFLGEYRYTLDIKKRLSIPAKFRKNLGKNPILTRGLDGCLFLYPRREWEKLSQKLGKLPLGKSDARGLQRLMLSGAMEVNLDSLGRILIPDYLKDYASLQKEVIIVGLYNHIEIWAKEKWEEYSQKVSQEIGNIAERLGELGV